MEACTRTSQLSDFESQLRCKLALARGQAFIGLRTMKILCGIIDPEITKNQSGPPQA